MNPSSGENLSITLNQALNNVEKTERLELSLRHAEMENHQRLAQLADRAKALGKPVDSGISRVDRPNQSAANYDVGERVIMDTEQGQISLSIFVYSPENESYGKSVYAAWHLHGPEGRRLLLEEYVSDRSLVNGIAAFNENAGKVLELLEESIGLYEQAALGPD